MATVDPSARSSSQDDSRRSGGNIALKPRSRDWLPAALIALVAFALRAYRLREYTAFQGDQGIDALAARHLVLDGVWPLEGPATSAGGVHLGPLYYYLLALPMTFAGFDPVVMSALIVVLATLAVVVLYWLLWLWFGRTAAIVGAGLYAVSPAAIVAGRSAWNPAPAPLFLVLALLGLAQTHRTRDARWLLLVGFGLGCLIQFHYFTLGVVVVCLGVGLYEAVRTRGYGWAMLGAAVFVGLLAPFAVHEVIAGFPNVQAARNLASTGAGLAAQDSVPRRLYAVLTLELVGGFLANGIEPLAIVLTVVLLVALARSPRQFPHLLLGLLLVMTLLQGVLYRGPIFAHYFVPLAPLLFLLVGAAVAQVRPFYAGLAFVPLLALSLAFSPLRDEPLLHVDRTEAVARAILDRTAAEPYALWLVSPNDSDAAYRYQLERFGHPPVQPSNAPARLFLVCQDQTCDQSAAGPDWSSARVSSDATLFGVRVLELER